jgi:hypothetical protein
MILFSVLCSRSVRSVLLTSRREAGKFLKKLEVLLKTYKNLYPQMCSFDNLYLAYLLAKKGKSGKSTVAEFMRKREDEIFALQEVSELRNQGYDPLPSLPPNTDVFSVRIWGKGLRSCTKANLCLPQIPYFGIWGR